MASFCDSTALYNHHDPRGAAGDVDEILARLNRLCRDPERLERRAKKERKAPQLNIPVTVAERRGRRAAGDGNTLPCRCCGRTRPQPSTGLLDSLW
jgi:hypothetical protein